jgi:hypothetical protein
VQALRRQGHAARLDEPNQWQDGIGAGDDVSLVLGDAAGFEPDPRALTLYWPAEGTEAPAPPFDHVLPATRLPPATDRPGWDAAASQISIVALHLLSAGRIG